VSREGVVRVSERGTDEGLTRACNECVMVERERVCVCEGEGEEARLWT
jgi:hypothetical protein